MNMRGLFGRLADALVREGKKDSAKRVLDRCFEVLPETAVSYDFFTVPLIESYYKIGETAKANAIAAKLTRNVTDELAYYFSFPDEDLKRMDLTLQEGIFTIQRLSVIVKEAKQDKLATEAETTFKKYYDLYVQKVYQPASQ